MCDFVLFLSFLLPKGTKQTWPLFCSSFLYKLCRIGTTNDCPGQARNDHDLKRSISFSSSIAISTGIKKLRIQYIHYTHTRPYT